MNKTLKKLAILASGLVVLSFVVVVVNQTAGVVQLAKEVHPALGTVTLWGLLIAYGGMIGVPIVIVLRMPKPLKPPASESSPEFAVHLKRLGDRLASNPHVRLASIRPIDRRNIEDALRILDDDADAIVKQMATTVFLTTAVSQSGRLDALLVLAAQSRMVWRIAHLYYQRPSLREMTHLYANVAATSFVAGELDDLELHQMIQPVVAGTLGAVGGVIPGFQVLTSILINSLLSGSANAFLTLRVGIIAKDYCGSLVAEPRAQVRRAATAQAARLLSGIVKESGARVREAVWKEIKQKIPRPWPMRKAQPETV
ncbi:MAG: DUF697 domain-containing protein [Isosphaerales bacterium]